VDLAQLVRILVVKLIYLDLNFRFDIDVIFMTNYFSVRCDVFIDSETLLMTDFVNLKIKLTQSFKSTYRNRVCMYIFIGINTYINICV
jgi:hypothetical protein